MRTEQRLRALEDALLHLREHASGAGVIVEGIRDKEALEQLGIGGVHVAVHRGRALETRIDEIAARSQAEGWRRVIVLMDWDRTGGRLAERLRQGLAARVPLDLDCRRRLAAAARARCVQEVPADLAALRARADPRG